MENILAVIILLIIVGGAIVYIIKEKRKGTKCIGCPAGGKCSHNNNSTCKCCKNKLEDK